MLTWIKSLVEGGHAAPQVLLSPLADDAALLADPEDVLLQDVHVGQDEAGAAAAACAVHIDLLVVGREHVLEVVDGVGGLEKAKKFFFCKVSRASCPRLTSARTTSTSTAFPVIVTYGM